MVKLCFTRFTCLKEYGLLINFIIYVFLKNFVKLVVIYLRLKSVIGAIPIRNYCMSPFVINRLPRRVFQQISMYEIIIMLLYKTHTPRENEKI